MRGARRRLHPVLAAGPRVPHRRNGAAVAADDFRSGLPRFTDEAQAANQAIVDAVRAVAERLGATPAQVALAWCLAQGERVVPIPGTRRLERLQKNLGAATVHLDDDAVAALDALPAPVGGRY